MWAEVNGKNVPKLFGDQAPPGSAPRDDHQQTPSARRRPERPLIAANPPPHFFLKVYATGCLM